MESRQIYEIVIKKQIEEYRQMLQIINKIYRADDSLRNASLKDNPDINSIRDITLQKEEWIKTLDELSYNVIKTRQLLGDYGFSLHDMEKSSIYQQMKLLESKCQSRLNQLIEKEDLQNPALLAHLKNYKERLELDIKINEIPMEKRKIFFVKL